MRLKEVRDRLEQVKLRIARLVPLSGVGVGMHPDYVEEWDSLIAERVRLQLAIFEMQALEREEAARTADAAARARMAVNERRIAAMPVYQRRNGWEIVKDGIVYVLRHPVRKDDCYKHHKLSRVREVADESPPDVDEVR